MRLWLLLPLMLISMDADAQITGKFSLGSKIDNPSPENLNCIAAANYILRKGQTVEEVAEFSYGIESMYNIDGKVMQGLDNPVKMDLVHKYHYEEVANFQTKKEMLGTQSLPVTELYVRNAGDNGHQAPGKIIKTRIDQEANTWTLEIEHTSPGSLSRNEYTFNVLEVDGNQVCQLKKIVRNNRFESGSVPEVIFDLAKCEGILKEHATLNALTRDTYDVGPVGNPKNRKERKQNQEHNKRVAKMGKEMDRLIAAHADWYKDKFRGPSDVLQSIDTDCRTYYGLLTAGKPSGDSSVSDSASATADAGVVSSESKKKPNFFKRVFGRKKSDK